MRQRISIPKTQRMLIGLVSQGMKRREMTQGELAKLTGLSAPYINQMLSGARPGRPGTWDLLLEAVNSDFAGLGTFMPELGRKQVNEATQWESKKTPGSEPRPEPPPVNDFDAL